MPERSHQRNRHPRLAPLGLLLGGFFLGSILLAVSADALPSGLRSPSEEESELFGLTHRTASDRPYFLLSYVAASGWAWQVDPVDPSENLACRVNDLRLAVGSGRDFGPLGVLAQASLRIGLSEGEPSQAGPLEPSCSGLRCAAYWDVSQPAGGCFRLQAVHRRVCWHSAAIPEGAGAPIATRSADSWAGSTMLEAAWGRFVGRNGLLSIRASWDLGGPSWRTGYSAAGYIDYRRHVNRRIYLQVGAAMGIDPFNPGISLAVGSASNTAANRDVSRWVQTLGWEVGLEYRPGDDEPYSGTLLEQDSMLTLTVRLLR